MQQEDERVRHPPPLAELAHHAVGHGNHPLDEAMSTAAELTIGRRNHLTGIHRPIQPDAVVLPEVGIARAAEDHPVRERPRLLADPLLPREMPASKPPLGRDPRHSGHHCKHHGPQPFEARNPAHRDARAHRPAEAIARAAGGAAQCRLAWNAALTRSPLLSADAGARRAGIARVVLLLIVQGRSEGVGGRRARSRVKAGAV